jgi:hypothetical protein
VGTAGGRPGQPGGLGPGDFESRGGAGGGGGGPFGGAGGAGVSISGDDGPTNGTNGGSGGYAAPSANGDSTTDDSLRMGSGGGGGSGGACAAAGHYSSAGGSGGGGAGNPGGATLRLVATESVVVQGTIDVSGRTGSTGDGRSGTDGSFEGWTCDLSGSGGDGGRARDPGTSSGGAGVTGYFEPGRNECIDRQCEDYDSHGVAGGWGGRGGPGAGGGVLLQAPSLTLSGTIRALGGGDVTINGGTVKILHRSTTPPLAGISAGRIHTGTY